MKDTYGNLIALMVYITNHFHPNSTNRIQIYFDPGKEVEVNEIIGIPTLKKIKGSIGFEVNFLTSPLSQTKFTIIYKPANTGYLLAPPLIVNNFSILDRLHHQVKP